jgi:pyruvate dehydrogenase E1 component beta subunit
VPGLKVVMPATPADAKGLLKASIRDDNPVIFIENKTLYATKGEVPDGELLVPLGVAAVRRPGRDVTVVGISRMVHEALRAADELARDGIDAEVIDPRTLSPLDRAAILGSVEKTGRLVVVHEAWGPCGIGAEIAAIAAEEAFSALRAPVRRVTAPFTPVPFSPPMEKRWVPDAARIAAAVRDVMGKGER